MLKNRIMCIILAIALLVGTIPEILMPAIVYAEEVIEEETTAAGEESEFMQFEPEVFSADLVDDSIFEETEEERQSLNKRENRSTDRAALVDTNKNLWQEMLSSMFGEAYFSPYNQNHAEVIEGNTNQLKLTETDLSLPGKNGLDLNLRRKYENQDYSRYYVSKKHSETTSDLNTYRYVYRFNTSDGSSIDVGFFTVDEFYIYMYDGCYITDMDFTSEFSSDSISGKGVSYQQVLQKSPIPVYISHMTAQWKDGVSLLPQEGYICLKM